MKSKMALGTVSNRLSALQRLVVSAKRALPSLGRQHSHYAIEKEYFDMMPVYNEKLLDYKSGSEERKQVKLALAQILNRIEPVPIVIDDVEMYQECDKVQILPYNRDHYIARYSYASAATIEDAIDLAAHAQIEWNKVKLSKRIAIWEKAADLIAGKYRFKIVAAIMLGQGKTLMQADMDVAELVDVLRINPIYLRDLANYEPANLNPDVCRNQMVLRGLNGFVAAITPFNYTSIAANLAYTPALMGNAVLWKPSDSALLSNWYVFQAMREAGVSDGVVNFVPARPTTFSKVVTRSSKLAGIHFTGTSSVLKILWRMVADKIDIYDHYPRLACECGGKNFHFVHTSADPNDVIACTIRAAFEYAGQKCSSCSMLYVPKSMWESRIKQPLLHITQQLFVSEATYCDCFFSAVINQAAFDRIFTYLRYIHNDPKCELLIGGKGSKTKGYYIDPTIVQVHDLDNFLCKDELMAPILCVYVYEDNQVEQTMEKVAQINHGLTASVFATDSKFIKQACDAFRCNVGTLNINDKCTGSKVGQQPFGGGAISGTNEKMGSPQYLLRWTSPQILKESLVPHTNIYYPYMELGSNELKRATLESRETSTKVEH
ncbi:delta-1-pyrroline-5-carboxylate dehydrogenase, mitochondrial [Drosophila albomicans]|uniref:Delta-1-pyrroline-5-carboxylate dehydrogenase, mitochondrial n=1 Tax=Drosophila albomicans TaxID=7291 RepID=A0A6P8Z989_DROAB|nr:delta-1-pyrroline-5-carboxylate dehydrogenase, mitochondrial [Drosophila albomicans]